MIQIKTGNAAITIDLEEGARLGDLTIGDLQLLVPFSEDLGSTLFWGCYPMAPWAGRVRSGIFNFEGTQYQLPLTMPPHAIHGTTFYRAWRRTDDPGCFQVDLGQDWPFEGSAFLQYRLTADCLHITLEVRSAGQVFPASCGLHPWFLKQLARGTAARLNFHAQSMYARDENQLVTGRLVNPSPGPWDDCFKAVSQPITITWPGALQLTLESNASHWVVYDEPEHAFCVEPLTGPPDAINLEPRLVSPDNPLILNTRLAWKLL